MNCGEKGYGALGAEVEVMTIKPLTDRVLIQAEKAEEDVYKRQASGRHKSADEG